MAGPSKSGAKRPLPGGDNGDNPPPTKRPKPQHPVTNDAPPAPAPRNVYQCSKRTCINRHIPLPRGDSEAIHAMTIANPEMIGPRSCKECLLVLLNAAVTNWNPKQDNCANWRSPTGERNVYGVERIVAHRRAANSLPEFRLQWLNGNGTAAWIHEQDLVNCGELIRRYWSTQSLRARQELAHYHTVASAVYRVSHLRMNLLPRLLIDFAK
jgi:hypothetical protein